ncbi:MAG: hypothetical protein HY000_06040, partial [Planctomycetes bacterium]|nr:hypothetical protein [Planctomycetota bacterium]
RAGGRPSPVDYAPHLWRQFQDRLLAYEAMRRASDSDESAQLSAMLRREMLPLPDLLASTAPVELDERATLAEQIACLKPSAPAGVSAPRSLAGAAALSWSSPELSAARIRDLAAQLEFWSASAPAREEYAKWVASLKPAERDLSELRWAAQIDALSELDWPTLQLALATRVAAERAVAAANGQRGWVDGLIADADARRLAGERRLLDSRGEVSSFAGAQRQLEAARSSYIQSIAHSELVKSVVQLRNELVFRAPSYVEWCGRGGLQESALGPARADVASLLATLSQLNDLLLAPDPANLGQLAKLQRQLTALRERVEVGLRGDLAGVLARSPATAGNVWRMELLLSTPLVDHDQRQRLAEAVVAAGVHKFDTRPDLSSVPPLLHVVAPQDLEKLFMRAELDVGLARLAGEPRSMDQAAGNGPQAAFDKLAAAQEQLRRESNPDLAGQPLWDAYRRFGSALGGLYRQLPAGINDALSSDYRLADQKTRADQLHTLARAEQQLRLLPGFAAPMPDRRSPLVSLRTAETYDELLWRRERLISAANDAPASEIAWLEQSAASYMHQATAIPGQPVPLESGGPAVALSGPSQLSLSDGSAHELLITLTNRRPAGVNAWVVLDYDPLLLEVVASPGHQVYRSDQLSSPNALLDRTPSATLRASADEAIPLRIIPKASAADRARLIVKVLTKEQIARHEIDLTLPGPAGIDLLVSGTPGTWQTTDSSLVLQPFPNTTTDYVLKLANRSPDSKRLRVDLMAAPTFEVAAGELDGAVPSGPILASAPELLLPSGGMPVAIEFPKPAAPATPAVPVLAPANQTAEGSGVPADRQL